MLGQPVFRRSLRRSMLLTKTFFSSRFGMMADRFGVSWMVLTLMPNP